MAGNQGRVIEIAPGNTLQAVKIVQTLKGVLLQDVV